ncbi:MAG: hypothetical protein ABIN74_14435, partial [Ferruginibacter sp.]
QFLNNIFYNTTDKLIYKSYDDISGISFSGNMVSISVKQNPAVGFNKAKLVATKVSNISIPLPGNQTKSGVYDSLKKEGKNRLRNGLSTKPGFSDGKLFLEIESNAKTVCGATWFKNSKPSQPPLTKLIYCGTAESIADELSKNDGTKLFINLTATTYTFKNALFIDHDVVFTSNHKKTIKFKGADSPFLVQLKAGNALTFKNLDLDLTGVNNFITTDTSGSSNHSNINLANSTFSNLNGIFFTAAASSVIDSMIIHNCTFSNNKGMIFNFTNERTNKGLYNIEKLDISHNIFKNCNGQILAMLRGGNDESTMGPYLVFSKNSITNCNTVNKDALIHIFGTQRSDIENNVFTDCNPPKNLVQYEDLVRAVHHFRNNKLTRSGNVDTNRFVNTK